MACTTTNNNRSSRSSSRRQRRRWRVDDGAAARAIPAHAEVHALSADTASADARGDAAPLTSKLVAGGQAMAWCRGVGAPRGAPGDDSSERLGIGTRVGGMDSIGAVTCGALMKENEIAPRPPGGRPRPNKLGLKADQDLPVNEAKVIEGCSAARPDKFHGQ